MVSKRVMPEGPRPTIPLRVVVITFLVLLLGWVGFRFFYYNIIRCIDGCGPYHNSASVADLDGDGDLDVVITNLRHETETVFWAGPTLWFNQGGGEFSPGRIDLGGPSTALGDIDADGDADIVQLNSGHLVLYLNKGGAQGGKRGEFSPLLMPSSRADVHSWPTPGTVVLGDLNNDGRLDALVAYCCSLLIDSQPGVKTFHPFLAWEWINTPDEKGRPLGHSQNLTSLGDMPMRPFLGDLDGDGDLDVFAAMLPPKAAGSYDSADRVLLNDGSGIFVDSGQRLVNARLAGAAGSAAVALGDLDGDGDLDALVGETSGALAWINQGEAQGGQAGIFVAATQPIPGNPAEAVFLADLDRDGDLDALLAGKSQAAIWWNDGRAGFTDSGQRLRYTERYGLAVGDFNADGYLDVFAAAYDTEFHLWLNQGDGRLQ
jgi:hypothetical protein